MVAVLGSGGHTAEMMSLLRDVDPTRWNHRTYIVSSGDSFSAGKALEIETRIQSKYTQPSSGPTQAKQTDPITGIWDIKVVPRARKIHQPLYTTPVSALLSLFRCIEILMESARASRISPNEYPDIIMTNGPATAVMVILASMILKFLGKPMAKLKIDNKIITRTVRITK